MTAPSADMVPPAEVRPAETRGVDSGAAETRAVDSSAASGPKLGAGAPRLGKIVLSVGAGAAEVLPQLTLDGRVGLGANTSIDVRYRNLAVFGHYGQARFTWATPISARVTFGLAARAAIGSLAQGDGGQFGLTFSSLALGNDLEVGHDLLLTWARPGSAHVTGALGPTYSLGGPRYVDFDHSKWRFDPSWQSVTATLLGEWELTPARRFFLRLDALFLIKADVVPYGFLPTFTIGHAWST